MNQLLPLPLWSVSAAVPFWKVEGTAQNIRSFRYYFKARTGVNESSVKLEFQKLFQKNDYEVWDNLQGSLLITNLNIATKPQFRTIVDNLNSPIYGFVNILQY